MKICILTHTFPRNKGDVAAAFMKEFADGLVENNHRVTVIAPFDPKFKRSGDSFKIVTYKYIWPDGLHLLGYSKTMKEDINLKLRAFLLLPFMLFFSFLTLWKTVKEENIDMISVHWILPNGLVALLVSKLTGVPYVITLPGTDAYLAFRFKIFGQMAKIIAQNSSGIVSNSSWHLKRILDLGVEGKLMDVISYPINVSSFKPQTKNVEDYRKKLGISKDDLVILAVGRLVYKKGFEYLIKSLPEVVKKYPNVHLIIGGEGDLKKSLENLVSKLKLSKYILFAGTIPRDEIIYYYNLADVMVAPSVVDKKGNVDGGPVVSMESMACGKPQVVTSILGVADLMKNGVNGYIVPQKNSTALAEAIIKLFSSKALRAKMGQANRNLVMTKLSTGYIGEKYSQLFEQIISTKVTAAFLT